MLALIRFAFASNTHQNEEYDEGNNMEVDFNVVKAFEPIELEGTSNIADNFGDVTLPRVTPMLQIM